MEPSSQNYDSCFSRSFAQVVTEGQRGKDQNLRDTIVAEEDSEWLNSYIVGTTKDLRRVNSVEEVMRRENVFDISVKPLGGFKVLLQFLFVQNKMAYCDESLA
ncbi:hypothetical protein U1Q18_049839 [Sarracenia purpurea var. burkii]